MLKFWKQYLINKLKNIQCVIIRYLTKEKISCRRLVWGLTVQCRSALSLHLRDFSFQWESASVSEAAASVARTAAGRGRVTDAPPMSLRNQNKTLCRKFIAPSTPLSRWMNIFNIPYFMWLFNTDLPTEYFYVSECGTLYSWCHLSELTFVCVVKEN